MKKILFITFYGLCDQIANAANSLKQSNYVIDDYPLFKYAFDSNEKKENYVEHCIDYVKESEADILIWWFVDIPVDELIMIREALSGKMFLLFLWNDILFTDNVKTLRFKQIFDMVYTSSKDSAQKFKNLGVKGAQVVYTGYDPKLFYTFNSEERKHYGEWECDVSMCLTKLYDNAFPKQLIERKRLIDLIYSDKTISFKLYGPPHLSQLYPDAYVKSLDRAETNIVHNMSKINISTHVDGYQDGYLNERVSLILGSGGLLYVDEVMGIEHLLTEFECAFIDHRANDEQILKQIHNIIQNYKAYERIKQRGQEVAEKHLQWENFACAVHRDINMFFFDEEFYQKTFSLTQDSLDSASVCNSSIRTFKDYWREIGDAQSQIAYNFKVPGNFDGDMYYLEAETETKDANNKGYIYWHWYTKSRDTKYMKRTKNRGGLVSMMKNVHCDQVYHVNYLLSLIRQDINITENLQELSKVLYTLEDYCLSDVIGTYLENANII